jgi:imidazolonepropionase-like amidohydrolase
MTQLLLRNARLLDVESGEYREDDLLAADGRIAETGPGLKASDSAIVLDAAGVTVLPGLIDAHVHVTACTSEPLDYPKWSASYVTAHAARIMSGMLDRGFTTVRDAGGADYGLADAQAEGLIRGPRLEFCGRPLCQSGGHGDFRQRGTSVVDHHPYFDHVVDGVDAVRIAAREELRRGAHHLKVMAGGGVLSITDRIDSVQYSADELRAIVDEAEAANRYVAAHAHSSRAVVHALEAGVRSIEHGSLVDDATVALIRERDAFLVPTLVTCHALKRTGTAYLRTEAGAEKVDAVIETGLAALERAHAAGVQLVFGTDLIGEMHPEQNDEFRLRAQVQPPLDVIRAATSTAAALLNRTGEIGTLRVGARADLVVVDGDPLTDIECLAEPKHIRYVVQDGRVVYDRSRPSAPVIGALR